MRNTKSKTSTVLACIDGSKTAHYVCDYASWISQHLEIPLNLLHTLESRVDSVSDFSGAIGIDSQQDLLEQLTNLEQKRRSVLIDEGQQMLLNAKKRAEGRGVQVTELIQRHGTLPETLIDLEDQIKVLVMGIRGETHDQDQSGVGHQLEAIIRSMNKAILVINKEFTEPKVAMLAYDGSRSCQRALHWLASKQAFSHIPCHIVYVGSQGERIIQEASSVLQNAGFKVYTKQVDGNKEEVLAQYQLDHQIDLMVMGAFSHNRLRGFLLGSFTEKMLSKTNRPLLLLRG